MKVKQIIICVTINAIRALKEMTGVILIKSKKL